MKKHLILSTAGFFLGIFFFSLSMYDGRNMYNPEEIIDCPVGDHTFSIMRKDCKETLTYKVYNFIGSDPSNW